MNAAWGIDAEHAARRHLSSFSPPLARIQGCRRTGSISGATTVALAGMGLFGVASLLHGLAPGTSTLVGARALEGLAAALLLPSTLAVLNRTFPERAEQARALGVWAGISALALPAGPLLGGVLVTAAGWPAVFLITLYLQGVQHYGPLTAGTMLLPLFIPLAICAPLTGRLAARYGPRPPMLGGLLLGAFGAACLPMIGPNSSYLVLVPVLLGIGLGMGLLTPSVVAAALQAGPSERPGLSSGVNNTARQAAGALGIAVFGAMVREPSAPAGFTSGLHLVGMLSVTLWLIAAVLTLLTVPRLAKPRDRKQTHAE
ncbi:MFS transporter [Nocardiopsis rhodophaea]|uniref:MFS transporter n=1 Tax=Nocardiopsis rhodophaea TaxID=280238 RepID=UPI0031DA3AE9